MKKVIFTISGFIIVIILLLIPLPEKAPLVNAIENTGHIPLFGFITWMLLIFLNRWHSKKLHPLHIAVISFMIAVGFGVGSELLQGMLSSGRTPEKKDVINNTIGALIAAVYWVTTRSEWMWQERWKKALRIGSFLLLIVPIAPIIEECILLVRRDRIFPVICSFEQPFEKRFIKGVWGTVLHRAPPPVEWRENHSTYAGRGIVKGSGIHTGIALSNIHPDWSGYKTLHFKVCTIKKPFSTITVWLTDGKKRKKFKDRLKLDYTLKDGENIIQISLPASTPDTLEPPLAINNITGFGLYFNDVKDTFTVWVDDFRLEDGVR